MVQFGFAVKVHTMFAIQSGLGLPYGSKYCKDCGEVLKWYETKKEFLKSKRHYYKEKAKNLANKVKEIEEE